MKIQVITDKGGNVLGTMRRIDGFDARVVPLPGQNVYELELPTELEGTQDLDQLLGENASRRSIVAFPG